MRGEQRQMQNDANASKIEDLLLNSPNCKVSAFDVLKWLRCSLLVSYENLIQLLSMSHKRSFEEHELAMNDRLHPTTAGRIAEMAYAISEGCKHKYLILKHGLIISVLCLFYCF